MTQDENMYQGAVIEAKTQKWEFRVFNFCSDILTEDEAKVFVGPTEANLKRNFDTQRLIRDLQHPNRMWMVDSLGRMTHYISWGPPGGEWRADTEPGTCPTCGDRGSFIRMALTCPAHGVFGGC